MKQKALIIVTGGVIGALAILLVRYGNPPNMGFCIACFLRDIAGGLGLHRVAAVQFLRPEIIGLVLGAFVSSIAAREFKALGGSSSLTRFAIGFFIMIGMLVFLGCPLRAILRLAGGDLNALAGLAGLTAGVLIGILFLRRGFSLGRAVPQERSGGYIFPAIMAVLLAFLLAKPAFIFFSAQGPGSMHAPVAIALAAGIITGILAQRSRLCLVGGLRDFILFRESYLLYGFFTILVVALAGNLFFGTFKPGFASQPIAHTDGLWNFLGMALAGFGAVLLGGCPLRQLVSAAEGNSDSAITVLGLLAGAGFSNNFGLAAGPQGVPAAGQAAVLIGLAVITAVGFMYSRSVAVRKGVNIVGGNSGRAGSPLSRAGTDG